MAPSRSFEAQRSPLKRETIPIAGVSVSSWLELLAGSPDQLACQFVQVHRALNADADHLARRRIRFAAEANRGIPLVVETRERRSFTA